eukprot:scaffold136286_cov40-Tisochrysis_lutea.AAC.1
MQRRESPVSQGYAGTDSAHVLPFSPWRPRCLVSGILSLFSTMLQSLTHFANVKAMVMAGLVKKTAAHRQHLGERQQASCSAWPKHTVEELRGLKR